MSAIGRKQTLVRAARYPGIRMMANGALAERVGFEPTVRMAVPAQSLDSRLFFAKRIILRSYRAAGP